MFPRLRINSRSCKIEMRIFLAIVHVYVQIILTSARFKIHFKLVIESVLFVACLCLIVVLNLDFKFHCKTVMIFDKNGHI